MTKLVTIGICLVHQNGRKYIEFYDANSFIDKDRCIMETMYKYRLHHDEIKKVYVTLEYDYEF